MDTVAWNSHEVLKRRPCLTCLKLNSPWRKLKQNCHFRTAPMLHGDSGCQARVWATLPLDIMWNICAVRRLLTLPQIPQHHKASLLPCKGTSAISAFLFINNCYASAIFCKLPFPWITSPDLSLFPSFCCHHNIRHLPILLEDSQRLPSLSFLVFAPMQFLAILAFPPSAMLISLQVAGPVSSGD